jgi:hypothetical protein
MREHTVPQKSQFFYPNICSKYSTNKYIIMDIYIIVILYIEGSLLYMQL